MVGFIIYVEINQGQERTTANILLEEFYNLYDIVYHLKVDYTKLKCYNVILMQALIQCRIRVKRQDIR